MSNEQKINLESKEISEDKKLNLRPKNLDNFIGQDNLKSNLKTYIESSKKTKNNLDHTILYGPVLEKQHLPILFLMKKM